MKFRILLLALLLVIAMLLSSCNNLKNNKVNNQFDSDIDTDTDADTDADTDDDDDTDDDYDDNDDDGADTKEEYNRYKDSPPGEYRYVLLGDMKPDVDDGVYCFEAKSYDQYLSEASTAISKSYSDEWISWEQFSKLGEFYSALYKSAEHAGRANNEFYYQYYSEAGSVNEGTDVRYTVMALKIFEDTGITNIKEYCQWAWGYNIPDDYYKDNPTYVAEDFDNPDLIECWKTIDQDHFTFFLNDELRVFGSTIPNDSGVYQVDFVYNGWRIIIEKTGGNSYFVNFDSSEDPEIIQKLLNVNTYKEAIAELMDPANGK